MNKKTKLLITILVYFTTYYLAIFFVKTATSCSNFTTYNLTTGCTSTPWWINFIYAIIGILLVWYFLKNINDYEDIFVKVKKELKTLK